MEGNEVSFTEDLVSDRHNAKNFLCMTLSYPYSNTRM